MISSTIHVAHSNLLNLGEEIEFGNLDDSLLEAAQGATSIDILGGYYSFDRTLALLKGISREHRRTCRVRIAVGLDASTRMTSTWRDMLKLESELRKEKFGNVETYVVSGYPHFHTKLFHFLRRTSHVWFIGSANPGSERHELMVSFRGKHEALKRYMDAVFIDPRKVTKAWPRNLLPATLREFFLTGVLLHKPPRKNPFSFEAFRLGPEDRARMMQSLTTDVVPHARLRTQGFAFSLRSAVSESVSNEEELDEVGRIQMRRYSVDTVLGSWAPRRYGDEIAAELKHNESSRLDELKRLAADLTGDGEAKAKWAFNEHVVAMELFLKSVGVDVRPVENREFAFRAFLKSRQKMLADAESVRRLSKRLQITDMPDIWNDESAARSFENSFFEDVAYRMTQVSTPRIVRSIAEGIEEGVEEYLSPDKLRDELQRRLEASPWADHDWIVE